ncbi:unnamed protein product [Aureobasidium uvarum]|uniref:C2H2-type domain-containing protein n=1 Tax=Aureobasidium uvarum TaxID=2773716 RepID=A0A9N8KAH7_9PEZI|nr:unnamed protein product [Aureobasidium uvarum]
MSYYCDSCDREFYSWQAVKQHIDALDHWQWPYECETCDKRFGDQQAVAQHMNALDHWDTQSSSSEDDEDWHECDRCERTFASWAACRQHMDALGHWFTDKCETCSRRFVNKLAAEQHMNALGHRSSQYCSSCDRYFQNASGLFQHMNSAIHLRADPIHAAPAPPTPRPPLAPVVVHVPSSAAAAHSSTLLATNSSTAPRHPPVVNTVPASSATPFQIVPLAPTIAPRQFVNPVLSNSRPGNTGTRSLPFSVVVEWDLALSKTIHYQSITFMQPYSAFSFEELRLVDYKDGRTPPSTNRRADAFRLGTAFGTGINPGADIFQPARSSGLAASPATISSTPSIPLIASSTYQDNSTQTDISPPGSSIYLSASSSRATTPSLTINNAGSRSSVETGATHTQEYLPISTADDIVGFHLVHEARSRVMKLVKHENDNTTSWVPQGVGSIRVLASKESAKLRIFMRADPLSKVVLDVNIALNASLYRLNTSKIVQLIVFPEDAKKSELFTCAFKDEMQAQEFLEKLHGAITKAQNQTIDHSPFSFTEVKTLQTEPIENPEVIHCPFCRLGFYALSEVVEHLETTSCRARPDLDCSVIYRHHRQHDPLGEFTGATPDHDVCSPTVESSLYRCFNTTSTCQCRGLPSFAALYAHLESESCGCIKRADLQKEFGNLEDLFPVLGSS